MSCKPSLPLSPSLLPSPLPPLPFPPSILLFPPSVPPPLSFPPSLSPYPSACFSMMEAFMNFVISLSMPAHASPPPPPRPPSRLPSCTGTTFCPKPGPSIPRRSPRTGSSKTLLIDSKHSRLSLSTWVQKPASSCPSLRSRWCEGRREGKRITSPQNVW